MSQRDFVFFSNDFTEIPAGTVTVTEKNIIFSSIPVEAESMIKNDIGAEMQANAINPDLQDQSSSPNIYFQSR